MILIYAILGICLLSVLSFLIRIPIKFIIKLVKNAIIGFILLLLANYIAGIFNIVAIEITPFRALMTGIFGIPWVIILFFIGKY